MQEYEQRLVARKAAMASGGGGGGGDGGGASALPEGLKLEDAAVLAEPGKRSGQIVVVRENSAAVAYSWDAARCIIWPIASASGSTTTGGRIGSGGARHAQRRERGRLREGRRRFLQLRHGQLRFTHFTVDDVSPLIRLYCYALR